MEDLRALVKNHARSLEGAVAPLFALLEARSSDWHKKTSVSAAVSAVSRRSPRARTETLAHLARLLEAAHDQASKGQRSPNEHSLFLDWVRILLSTAERVTPESPIRERTVFSFGTSDLWGRYEIDKVGSRVVNCLASFRTKEAFDLLLVLWQDSTFAECWLDENRHPQEHLQCFGQFGSSFLPRMEKEARAASVGPARLLREGASLIRSGALPTDRFAEDSDLIDRILNA